MSPVLASYKSTGILAPGGANPLRPQGCSAHGNPSVQAHVTATTVAVKNPVGIVSVQNTLTRLIANIYLAKDRIIIFLCQDNREPEQFLNSLMGEKG